MLKQGDLFVYKGEIFMNIGFGIAHSSTGKYVREPEYERLKTKSQKICYYMYLTERLHREINRKS